MTRKEVLDARLKTHRSGQASREVYLNNLRTQSLTPTASSTEKTDRLTSISEDHLIRSIRVPKDYDVPLAKRRVMPAIALSTGIMSLDYALGMGLMSGTLEIFGEESTGKTTLGYEILRSAQHNGKMTLCCASEPFDMTYAHNLGVDINELFLCRAVHLEGMLETVADFFKETSNGVVLIDSATAFRPEDDSIGNWHRIWKSFLFENKIPNGSVLILINQVRQRTSADPRKTFAGGTDSAARKTAEILDTRLELLRESVSEKCYQLVIKIIANPLCRPAAILKVPVVKGKGVDVARDLVRVASATGVFTKSGSYYYFNKEMIGHGEEEAAETLVRDRPLMEDIVRLSIRKLKGQRA
jgi:recombination protein RecA